MATASSTASTTRTTTAGTTSRRWSSGVGVCPPARRRCTPTGSIRTTRACPIRTPRPAAATSRRGRSHGRRSTAPSRPATRCLSAGTTARSTRPSPGIRRCSATPRRRSPGRGRGRTGSRAPSSPARRHTSTARRPGGSPPGRRRCRGSVREAVRRLLLVVSAIVFVDTTFYAVVAPLLPHYADELDLSKASAGILLAAYPAGTLVGSLPSGVLAARVGARRTVLTGLALLSISSIGFALAGSELVLDLARFVQGLGGACSWAGGLAWLVAASPPDRRGELIGVALGAAIGGSLLGPVLGAAAVALGARPVFGAVAAVGCALAFVAAATPEAGGPIPAGATLRRTLSAPR